MIVTIFSQISIDGKLTFGTGQSSKELFRLFNEQDMEYIHRFRGKVDAIMVGKNTIRTDNPFLTNRYESNKNPVRIIPTRTMDIPLDSNVFTDDGKTIIVTTEKGIDLDKQARIRDMGKDVLVCGVESVDFTQLFIVLQERYGLDSIMVEGGGLLNWHVVHEDLVDEIILMQLPIIIGGASNITLVDGEGYSKLSFTKKFKVTEVQAMENYTLMRYAKRVSLPEQAAL